MSLAWVKLIKANQGRTCTLSDEAWIAWSNQQCNLQFLSETLSGLGDSSLKYSLQKHHCKLILLGFSLLLAVNFLILYQKTLPNEGEADGRMLWLKHVFDLLGFLGYYYSD